MLKNITKFLVLKFSSFPANLDMFVSTKQIRKFDGSSRDILKNYPSYHDDGGKIKDAVKAALKCRYFEKNNFWSTILCFQECFNPTIFLSADFERVHLHCLEKRHILRYYSGIIIYIMMKIKN